MFDRIAHVGIAVKDLGSSIETYTRLTGSGPVHSEEVPDQRVRTAMFRMGETTIELLEPTVDDSAVGRFLERRGEGIHHVAISVADIKKELVRLKAAGFRLIDEHPRVGADNCHVAFIHPKAANGVLIELVQKMR